MYVLVVHNSILAATNPNLVKIKFPHINTFYCELLNVINTMRGLTAGIFEDLNIMSKTDVYKSVRYI